MLIHQAVPCFERWFGFRPPIDEELLTKINKAPIDTFSVEFEDKQYDESVAQHEVKNFIKSNHKSIKISKSDIANNFEKTVNHAEQM